MDALNFLEQVDKAKPQPFYVLAGEELFLKRAARNALQGKLLGDADPAFAVSPFEGTDDLAWSVVKSELDTLPFLSPVRVVIIEQADPFVSENRAVLEKYHGSPSSSGVLILEVKSWLGTTKLAKLVPHTQTILCKPPKADRAVPWCVQRLKQEYGKEMPREAAEVLVEMVGLDLGKLDQELNKLASSSGDKKVSRTMVEELVGRSRMAEMFKIFDHIGNGDAAGALAILGRLLEQGEAPQQILGAFSWKLRQLAKVSRSVRAGQTVQAAMDRSSVPPFARQSAETQLRRLGRERMDKVYDWLLATDLAMKSTGRDERLTLERLVVQLCMPVATQ